MNLIKFNICEALNLSNYVFEKTKNLKLSKTENTDLSLITILVDCFS